MFSAKPSRFEKYVPWAGRLGRITLVQALLSNRISPAIPNEQRGLARNLPCACALNSGGLQSSPPAGVDPRETPSRPQIEPRSTRDPPHIDTRPTPYGPQKKVLRSTIALGLPSLFLNRLRLLVSWAHRPMNGRSATGLF